MAETVDQDEINEAQADEMDEAEMVGMVVSRVALEAKEGVGEDQDVSGTVHPVQDLAEETRKSSPARLAAEEHGEDLNSSFVLAERTTLGSVLGMPEERSFSYKNSRKKIIRRCIYAIDDLHLVCRRQTSIGPLTLESEYTKHLLINSNQATHFRSYNSINNIILLHCPIYSDPI